ncbi:NCS1 allantoate transporter [Phyllosticta citrichinensis]|uniref:NCS1 allantoate transporter n=1 Tax=Phyllosticta citrichinensis TaxID=1130410 RepID=A0ABR1XYY5_9PEZI
MKLKIRFQKPTLHVEQSESEFAKGSSRWTNVDLDPVPRRERKWGVWSFVAYWISDAFNAASWEFASSVIAVGLGWRETLGIVALGFFMVSIVIALNGAIGSIYHAPFPVLARAGWGFWGSYVAILSRVVLAVFWFAVQTMNGANCVRVMIGAIWPSFLTLRNDIPESEGITTATMISFFLFWLLQLPLMAMHPNKLRYLFVAKSIIVPPTFIAILIWSFVATRGKKVELWSQPTTAHGSAYVWAFLSNLTSIIGNYATLSVNQADFSRYSRVSVRWQAMYVPMLPVVFTFIAFIGIAASAAGATLYPSQMGGSFPWDPMVLVSLWLSRAARFFAGASFALAAVGVNVSANSLSAANDLAALFPLYVDIRRGQLVTALLAWPLVPWEILASAAAFLNFMSAYAVFLGPVAAVMCLDFWLVKRRRYDVRALYDPQAAYRYNSWGVNWCAVVAFVVGVAPSLPGFINSVNSDVHVGVGDRPYAFGWLLGFVGTATVYCVLEWLCGDEKSRVEKAVLPDDVYDGDVVVEGVSVRGRGSGSGSGSVEEHVVGGDVERLG